MPNDQKIFGNNYGRRWNRFEETFETLSITPSIDATKDDNGNALPIERQHWQGFITNGEIK